MSHITNAFDGLPRYSLPDETLESSRDQISSGIRKVPGYKGHVQYLQNTCGTTYGNATAKIMLGEQRDAISPSRATVDINNITDNTQRSGILNDNMGSRKIVPDNSRPRIVVGYGGAKPELIRTVGKTFGAYTKKEYEPRMKAMRNIYFDMTTISNSGVAQLDLEKPNQTSEFKENDQEEKTYLPGTTYHIPRKSDLVGVNTSNQSRVVFGGRLPSEYTAPKKFVDWDRVSPHWSGFKPSTTQEYLKT